MTRDATCQSTAGPRRAGRWVRRAATALVLGFALSGSARVALPSDEASEKPRRPNFVVVLADDLGYGDLGCYGNRVIQTPHLDRLARDGLRLTHCYAAAANCSPARAGLLTGRTPFRAGIYNWIPMYSPMHLRRGEVTVASLLREAGYATCHVGKWHLNGGLQLRQQPQPVDHGFDHSFGTQNNALPTHENPDNFFRNGEAVGPLRGFSASLVAEEAIHWLESQWDGEQPFFLYVCFHEPHEPIATDARFEALYADLNNEVQARHHGNVTQLDEACGRLFAAIEALGIARQTFIWFTSDNGPAITAAHPFGSAGPLRAKKGYLYEGGIRVPGILRWPGRIRAGQVSREPICGLDLLPTLCELAGIETPGERHLDGASFVPLLDGRAVERTQPLYWQFNRARSQAKVALRDGDWKLLATLTGPALEPTGSILPDEMKIIKAARLRSFQLYNLRTDEAEEHDLADEQPAKRQQLADRLRPLYQQVRDASPVWPAWVWPRYEADRIRQFRESQQRGRQGAPEPDDARQPAGRR